MFLGLDLGTSGVKALALDSSGEMVASASESYELYHPHPGWSEQHPSDWWEAVQAVLSKLLSDLQDPDAVRSLALSGQMHGAVLLDEEGEVLRPAILWNDTRTDQECRDMTEAIGERRLIELSGNPALEGFTAPKLLWIKKNEPEIYEQIDTLLLPKDYIVYRLTGRRVTERSDAAGTNLLDVDDGTWSDTVLDELGLSGDVLPDVLASTDVVGTVLDGVAEDVGCSPDTKVVAGGADNACSAVGNGIVRDGSALVSVGTSGVVLGYSDEARRDFEGGLHCFNHAQSNAWYLMGVMLSATGSINWFTEQFAGEERRLAEQQGTDVFELLEREANDVEAGSDGLFFLPYLTGERTPHQDADARGVFFGIHPQHTKYHFYRAVIEGVAFGLRDSFELLQNADVPIDHVRITGGGSSSELWCRIIASVLDQPITRMKIQEGPAFGAAMIAGVGEGSLSSLVDAADQFVETSDTLEPDDRWVEAYREAYPLFGDLYQSLESDYKQLSKLQG